MNTYIIAEAGVNHNGSLTMAKELVSVAKRAGANAVKFQTFKTENLVTKDAEQADYQINNLGQASSQFEMLKKLELSYEDFIELKKYCENEQIEFLSTPFDYESVDFLLEKLQLSKAKIPSGEMTNSPFVHYIATKQKPIILSTGMAMIEEIHEALSFIAYGLAFPNENVIIEKVKAFYDTEDSKKILREYVTVLHCTTEYPAPYETINLNALNQMKNEFQVSIGLSDHSEGVSVPVAAVALGAELIEKHFTLDKNLEGPDHVASLDPNELADMVRSIREIEKAFGSGIKMPTFNEIKNRSAARKSLVAKIDIQKGEFFTQENLISKRPGNGMPPSTYWSILGKEAKKSYQKDEMIDE
ncbi:N-acetylneuraminate synthase [Paenisporosarcina cavernae]|uniref:N-acetylneuraminate synthase n=1 Tax=Paenisporosarcina cavernae TaxID=2320858 RepID=A0A385YQF0_9BACL|nr:N-acetylneuraminate synthase [Paenisporosarcina cavernae]AYC28955.1 N-acetylneuraminate synthase [Paenisporosarcina cavernae]